jgi:hypothetical protein
MTQGVQVCTGDGDAYGTCDCPTSTPDMMTTVDMSQQMEDIPSVDSAPEGLDLLGRIAGVWQGPATNTPLGSFPRMALDFQPLQGGRMVFGRVDLDAQNALRMAFFLDLVEDTPVVTFRNGGLFMGLSRDTLMTLKDHDDTSWRFCGLEQGCEAVEATLTIPEEDSLTLDVRVRGMDHLTWRASRLHDVARDVPIPIDERPHTPGGLADFPDMPTFQAELSWSSPLTTDADVWVTLSSEACGLTGRDCVPRRSIATRAMAGATSVMVTIAQIHPGDYVLNGILDRNDNLRQTNFPDRGDELLFPTDGRVTLPQSSPPVRATFGFTLP